MSMSWKQLKAEVDAELVKNGFSEDDEIDYVDISFPTKGSFGISRTFEGKNNIQFEDTGI